MIRLISFGSDAYEASWKLREEILRLPLGLKFTDQDREAEKTQIHIAAFKDGKLVGAAVLAPLSNNKLKMQRVAICEDQRGIGLGSKLAEFSIRYARDHKFKEITCHAREAAIPFYEKNGFSKVGSSFIEQTIPHQKMTKAVTPAEEVLIVVDLEATCSDDNRISRDNMEIIEIGAAAVCLQDFEIAADFQLYVKPVINPTLTPFCTKLTGIKQTTIDHAHPFSIAVKDYCDWLAGFDEIAAWASWGNYDKGQFEIDYARHNVPNAHKTLPHLNLKNLFAEATEQKRMGLGQAITFAGSEFEGRAHCGRDDALNMSRLLTLSTKFGALVKERLVKSRRQ